MSEMMARTPFAGSAAERRFGGAVGTNVPVVKQMSDHTVVGPFERGGGSVRDELLHHLQRLIVTGVLQPGDKLANERDLAAGLGVSRSALREALLRLESAGLIERRQGSGTRVSPRGPLASVLASSLRSEDDDAQIAASAEFRTVVEPQIARLAASRIDDDEIADIAALLQESASGMNADRSVGLDVRFHVAVAAATRNSLLASLSELTVSWTVEARIYSHLEEEGRRLSHDGHSRILKALAARNPDAAEAAMRVHLDEIAELIERVHDASDLAE